MKVKMENRLARSRTVIDTNVVAGWMAFALQSIPNSIQEREHCYALFLRGVEERVNMATRQYEAVAGRDGIRIPDREGKLIRQNDSALWEMAERTGLVHRLPSV
jgi:hypothetical protein